MIDLDGTEKQVPVSAQRNSSASSLAVAKRGAESCATRRFTAISAGANAAFLPNAMMNSSMVAEHSRRSLALMIMRSSAERPGQIRSGMGAEVFNALKKNVSRTPVTNTNVSAMRLGFAPNIGFDRESDRRHHERPSEKAGICYGEGHRAWRSIAASDRVSTRTGTVYHLAGERQRFLGIDEFATVLATSAAANSIISD